MLMNKLSIIARHSRVFSSRALQQFGIGHPEQIILMFLAKNDNVNQDTIAKYFDIDKGTVAKTLSKLEDKKYIQRVINVNNQREKLISLSEKGKGILEFMENVLKDWDNKIYDGLSDNDIKEFDRIITKMVSNASKV